MRSFSVEEITQIVGGMLSKSESPSITRIAPPLLADENCLALALGEEEKELCIAAAFALWAVGCGELLIFALTALKKWVRRLARRREKKFRQRPDTIVTAHAKAFEPPTKEEGWDEIIVI